MNILDPWVIEMDAGLTILFILFYILFTHKRSAKESSEEEEYEHFYPTSNTEKKDPYTPPETNGGCCNEIE